MYNGRRERVSDFGRSKQDLCKSRKRCYTDKKPSRTAQIHLTPKEINVDELSFDDGQYERYYGREGAVYVDIGTNSIRTAYGKAEFDDSLKNLVKEMERNGLLGERGV